MGIPIGLGLIYLLTVFFGLVTQNWLHTFRKRVIILHFGFFALLLVDLLLVLTTERDFRGVYSDRIVFWGLLLSGALLFFCVRKKGNLALRIYSGVYAFYPILAMATILIDRLFFVIVAGPILASVIIPEIYYKSDEYDIRGNTGFLAPKQMVLVKKGLLTEKQIGRAEYPDEEGFIKVQEIEMADISADSVFVKIKTKQRIQLIMFRK